MPGWNRLVIGLGLALIIGGLGGCAGPSGSLSPSTPPSAGYYKVGKPYQVAGVWYYPAEDYNYDETGVASWYGPGFDRGTTANGETYDQMQLTAAHRTLPMPSLVRVTNLENGRQLVVRINDRGPFKAGRILDLSYRSAELLGVQRNGTAKVRVTILAKESREIAEAARARMPPEQMAAFTGPAPSAAPRDTVEAVSLAPPGGAGRLRSDGAPPQPTRTEPRPWERQAAATAEPAPLPGNTVNGRFLPAAAVTQAAVTGNHQLYVQAGAFSNSANANRLRSQLSSLGPVQVTPVWVGRSQFFRVRVGPLAGVEAADDVLARVIQAGNNDARVVVD